MVPANIPLRMTATGMKTECRSTNVPLAPGQEMPDPLKETVYSAHWGCNEQFESGLIYFVSRIRDRRFRCSGSGTRHCFLILLF